MLVRSAFFAFFVLTNISLIYGWTDEDLQLFDLVENTDRKFYDILGVDQKASPNDIRKAYRKLSQQYHPDRNKDPNAEEMFRKIAAISEVLRNEDLRKKYDIILQTGLPDWREPIYYYRRVRNMGLFELIAFLFCLATLAQYLFAWSVYWEKKYEIEELVSSKMKKKTKHQRKGKSGKAIEEMTPPQFEIENLPKPRYQDLFPVQLFSFLIRLIKSSPSYLMSCLESLQSLRKPSYQAEEDADEEVFIKREMRPKTKKHLEPLYPELSRESDDDCHSKPCNGLSSVPNDELQKSEKNSTETDIGEFKKALKKFPNGTLQRWEKIANYLNCSVPEVIAMTKQMKVQQFSRNVPISSQGLTGFDDFSNVNAMNGKMMVNGTDHESPNGTDHKGQNGTAALSNGHGTVSQRAPLKAENASSFPDAIWKQEEQKLLELALQKYSKETPSRWDRIAEFVQSKTKEECVARYKWLAQEIRKKKEKEH